MLTLTKQLTVFVAFLLIAGGFVVVGNVAAAKESAPAKQQYVIQLSTNDSSLLSAIPGLTDIVPFEQQAVFPNTYRFNSTVDLEVLRKVYAGHYLFLDSDTILSDSAKTDKKLIPNDPGVSRDENNIDRQWGLYKANFFQAWQKTTGTRDTVVAVIDTGVDGTHEDFSKTRFVPGYNVLTGKGLSKRVNSDDNGHGTLVAGVIAASTNNDQGIAGAAYGVSIMPIKALDSDGTGSSSDISEAIVWAADNGADVINLSLGGIGFAHDTVLANAITFAYQKNVVIVAAAGNDVAVTGGNLDKEPVFPICHDNGKNMVIGVTATDVKDLKPTFANYGKACVDVSAPGRRILSTINHDPTTGGNSPDSYAYASGTSLAVPHVSAQAALLRSLFPNASNRQIRDRIIGTADNIDSLNISQCAGGSCAGLLGGGRINAAKSLEGQIITLVDGDVVQVAGTTDLYLINGGKRQRISPFVRNQRFAAAVPQTVSNSDLQYYPEGSYAAPLDGTLVKSPNDPTVYYILSGLRRPVTGQIFNLRGFKYANIVTLTNVEVGSWIEGSFLAPPDASLVRTPSSPTLYWVVDGILHPVNYNYYVDRGLKAFPVVIISENDLGKLTKGEPYIL